MFIFPSQFSTNKHIRMTSTTSSSSIVASSSIVGINDMRAIDIMNDSETANKKRKLEVTSDSVIENVSVVSPKKDTPKVINASNLNFKEHVKLMDVYTSKKSGFKSVKVNSTHGKTNRPLIVQFSNKGGTIPVKFGIDSNIHGKTYLTFPITCDEEYAALKTFQDDVKEFAKLNKGTWWSYPVNDKQVEDNFANLVSDKKEKRDGDGYWPGNMKAHIPMTEDGVCKCEVLDHNGNAIPISTLPGSKWSVVMIEMSGIYFQNRFNWGFGPKTLRLVKVSESENDTYNPENESFAALMLPKGVMEE